MVSKMYFESGKELAITLYDDVRRWFSLSLTLGFQKDLLGFSQVKKTSMQQKGKDSEGDVLPYSSQLEHKHKSKKQMPSALTNKNKTKRNASKQGPIFTISHSTPAHTSQHETSRHEIVSRLFRFEFHHPHKCAWDIVNSSILFSCFPLCLSLFLSLSLSLSLSLCAWIIDKSCPHLTRNAMPLGLESLCRNPLGPARIRSFFLERLDGGPSFFVL